VGLGGFSDSDLRNAVAAAARLPQVFLPLGVRTIAGVMLQIDKSLEDCAQMCGGLGVGADGDNSAAHAV